MMLTSPTGYALESQSRLESVMGPASSRLGSVDDQNKKERDSYSRTKSALLRGADCNAGAEFYSSATKRRKRKIASELSTHCGGQLSFQSERIRSKS